MRSLTLTSRADLLRQLKQHRGNDDKSLAAGILGYELLLAPEDVNQGRPADVLGDDFSAGDLSAGEQQAAKTDSDTAERVPDERFIALRSREQYADPASLQYGLPECLQGVEPLSDADLQPIDKGEPLLHQPLVQQSRLLPFLQRSLVYPLGERLDVARLVRKVARLEVLHRIPRKAHILPAGRVYVLLDLNKRLLPFWEDAHQLCDLLARKLGRNGLAIRVLEEDAVGGRYSDWFDEQRVVRDWLPLKSPAVVLVVSDLGGLARSGAPLRATWLAFMRQLGRKNIRPLVLTPCVAAVCTDFRFHADLVAWGRGSRFKKQTICRVNPDFAVNVRRVLGLLSVAVHIEPVLLRAILGCLPAHEADSDVEAAVYCHEDMVWGHTAVALNPEKREEYRALFRDEEVVIQRQVLVLIRQQHIGQFPFVWASTVINAQPLVNFSLAELPDADIAWAEQLMQRFTRSFAGQTEHQGMVQFARRELQRLGTDDGGESLCQEYASTLHGLAYRDSLRAGLEIPAKYDAATVQAVVGDVQKPQRYLVTQVGEDLYLALDGDSSQDLLIGSLLGETIINSNVVRLTIDGVASLQAVQVQKPLCHLVGVSHIQLDTGLERLILGAEKMPSWAQQIVRERYALKARKYFGRWSHSFQWQPDGATPAYLQKVGWEAYEGGSAGIDQYGFYADLTIKSITQRFRWIEPGTFLMGSPEGEPGRDGGNNWDNDEDQHTVTLTKGYWLSDTTINQALWATVMGDNPSLFNGNDRPVERVSWNDCQQFIQKLNQNILNLQAKLPTEAEWEYACRAGTITPFNFGGKHDLNLDRVNYGSRWDGHGHNGESRSVKSYPPNSWGLYEMHGNVDEWCQDQSKHSLGSEPAIDPLEVSDRVGWREEASGWRVIRGGAWESGGQDCRSACRRKDVAKARLPGIGFRLLLEADSVLPVINDKRAESRPVVLIVDDEKSWRMILARWFSSCGFEVLTAEGLDDACRVFDETENISLVSTGISFDWSGKDRSGLLFIKFLNDKAYLGKIMAISAMTEFVKNYERDIDVILPKVTPDGKALSLKNVEEALVNMGFSFEAELSPQL